MYLNFIKKLLILFISKKLIQIINKTKFNDFTIIDIILYRKLILKLCQVFLL